LGIGQREFQMGSKMKKLTGIAAITLVVSACASHTGIVPMGRDTFMIAKQQATGFPGLGNMKAEIIAEASQYCAAQGKELQIVSTQETQPPYILGNYPRSEIQFMCLAAGDRELHRPKLQKAPDTVI
jgi:putative hemolysin